MELIEVLSYSIDEDGKTIGLGTSYGFVVYGFEKKDPYVRFKRTLGSGIGLISVYKSSSIVAYVGGGNKPYSRPNDVEIWDDSTSSVVFKKKFDSDVRNILLKKNYLIVVLDNYTLSYTITSGNNNKVETCYNPDGIVAFYQKGDILITPSEVIGNINIYKLGNTFSDIEVIASNVICCKHQIGSIVIEPNGKYVVVFCLKTQKFIFIDLQTKQKYFTIANQGNTIKKQPFILLSQVLLVVVSDELATFYDILKSKKNKIYSVKLDKKALGLSFLTTWQPGGPKLHLIDKTGNLKVFEILINTGFEVTTVNLLSKALLQ